MKKLEVRGGGRDDCMVKRPPENILIYFGKMYRKVLIVGVVAILYCLGYLIFKSSSIIRAFNLANWVWAVGEFLFNIAISLIAAEIFFIFQIVIPEHKKAPAVNEALCQELYRYIITPCSKLKWESYNNDLIKNYEVRQEIINSIQKILVVYTIQDDLFDALMKLKGCGYLESAATEDTEDCIIEYHKTGKELLEEFDSYCTMISEYCREHQEWIRVDSTEYEKLTNGHSCKKKDKR